MRILVLNPKTKAKGRKMPKKKKAAKRKTKAIARVSNPAPAKKRRRSKSIAKKAPKRRRRNPSVRGIAGQVSAILPGVGGATLSAMAANQVGKRMPDALAEKLGTSLIPGRESLGSEQMGQSWNLAQYAAAIATGIYAPKLAGRMMTPAQKQSFTAGSLVYCGLKVLFTEVFARSPAMSDAFGGYTGRVIQRGRQRYAELTNGTAVALQGVPVQANQLDGVPVRANHLGGVPVRASHLDTKRRIRAY